MAGTFSNGMGRSDRVEPWLVAAMQDLLARPGSLVRASVAYLIGIKMGFAEGLSAALRRFQRLSQMGDVRVAGNDVVRESTRVDLLRHHSGYVFQFHHLMPGLTLGEHCMVPVIAAHDPELASRCDRAVGRVAERIWMGAEFPLVVDAGLGVAARPEFEWLFVAKAFKRLASGHARLVGTVGADRLPDVFPEYG